MNMLICGIKRQLSGKFFIAVSWILLIFLFSTHYVGNGESITAIELFYDFFQNQKSEFCFQKTIEVMDGSYWFPMILPCITSFVAVTDFHEEWYSSYFYMNIARQGIINYTFTKTII